MAWPALDDNTTAVDWTRDFHTFAVDWSEHALTWVVDGVPRYTRTRADPMAGFFLPTVATRRASSSCSSSLSVQSIARLATPNTFLRTG